MSLRWPDFWCMLCHERRPSCPMLRDDVWVEIWARAREAGAPRKLLPRPPGCPPHEKQLLCMECAERCLGRHLTLDDLEDCVGNLAIRLWVGRLTPPTESATVGS